MGPGLVRMDIATNKEQCQDKEMLKKGPVNKKSRPVVTDQRAAQRKNSPRQWGRPFGRAPREICPAISTHPHWGGDCTTNVEVAGRWCRTRYRSANWSISGKNHLANHVNDSFVQYDKSNKVFDGITSLFP